MALIPEPEVTMEELIRWDKLQRDLKILKAEEALLRGRIAKFYFKNPKEGTNDYSLNAGYVLKMQHKISRDFDVQQLKDACDPGEEGVRAPGAFIAAGFDVNPLVKWKPELVITAYRKLSPENRQLLDTVLQIKDGSPQLEITLPAAAAKAQATAVEKAAKK